MACKQYESKKLSLDYSMTGGWIVTILDIVYELVSRPVTGLNGKNTALAQGLQSDIS